MEMRLIKLKNTLKLFMIKVIGFDLGGVYLSDCWVKSVREKIVNKFNISKKEFEENNDRFEQDITEGKISESVFLKKLVGKNKNIIIQEIKQYIRRLNKIICPEIFELMERLKKNYKLVLINNEGKEWNEFRIKKFHLNKIFDKILTSCILKDSKPNKSYFKKVLSKLNIKPSELLFIDDKAENITSANRIGIKTIYFRNPHQLKKELSGLGIKL